uniref:Uncharacterized protein n=1 Tax=Ralstonia syzygii R24 TaxID=907261 RepID=G3A703_9RALS|nr:hypothetical protein RALSY_40477 [Ralstonia syzygii R24]
MPHDTRIRLGPEVLDLTVSAVRANDGSYIGPMLTWALVRDHRGRRRGDASAREKDPGSRMQRGPGVLLRPAGDERRGQTARGCMQPGAAGRRADFLRRLTRRRLDEAPSPARRTVGRCSRDGRAFPASIAGSQ